MFTVSPAWHVTVVRNHHSTPIHKNRAGNFQSRDRRVACPCVRTDKLVDPITSFSRLHFTFLEILGNIANQQACLRLQTLKLLL